jgi:hypothetical protein
MWGALCADALIDALLLAGEGVGLREQARSGRAVFQNMSGNREREREERERERTRDRQIDR